MNFTIKHFTKLTSEEVFDIASLRASVFLIEQNIREEDLDILDKDAYHMFLKEEGIIAYCRILKPHKVYSEASIGRVLVKKEYRGKKIAREMMKEAVNFIFNDLNENSIKISAQCYVIPMYESIGFKRVGDVYSEVGIDHIKMILNKF